MNKLTTIALEGFAGEISISPEADVQKQALIAKAKTISEVSNDDQLMLAVDAERDLKQMRIAVEKTRKEIKAPVLELGRKIDSVAEEFTSDIEREEKRLMGHINHFQRKRLEEQRKAEEIAKAEEAKKLAEIAAMEARVAKLNAEADSCREVAELDDILKETKEVEEKLFESKLELELSAPKTTDVTGLSSREVLDYEIIGTNAYEQAKSLVAFAMANPNLVKIEIKRLDLLDALNNGRITDAPGIKIVKTIKTTIR